MARVVSRPHNHRPTPPQNASALASLTAAAPLPPSATGAGGVKSTGNTTSGGNESWQAEAWNFYDVVPELRYVCAWLSNALSRCSLVPSEVNAETGQPTGDCSDEQVIDLVGDIAGGPAGQAQLLGRLATFLTVPGDSWVAIIVRRELDADGDPIGEVKEEWHVLSKDEVNKRASGQVEITLPDGTKHMIDEETDSLSRVHRPHPRNAQMSDSPVRACIPVLREILRLGQWVEATAKSRLTGAGLLAIASEISAPRQTSATPRAEPVFGTTPIDPDAPTLPTPTPDGFMPPEQPTVDSTRSAQDLMDLFIEVAQAAINDPASGSATVPVVLQGPGEHIDKIKHMTFGQEFTDVVIKLREAATRRLALTLDVPAEVLMGTGDMNHWSAWQVEESAIKLHVEPLLTLICDALTRHILRPLLELHGHSNPDGFVIWYSTANLALRPNRSADAKEAYAAGVLSTDRYLMEIGFDPEDDAPTIPATDDERFALAYRMAMGGNTQFARAVAEMCGINLPASPGVDTGATSLPPSEREEEPDTQPGDDDVAPVPEQPSGPDEQAVAASLFASVVRRLDLAGKRMRTRGNLSMLAGVDIADTHVHLPAVNNAKALSATADSTKHDALLAIRCGVDPKMFTEFSHTVAMNLVLHRKPIATAAPAIDRYAAALAERHPNTLRSVQ